MKEYKILRQIRFILEGDTVSEEELDKKFTKCAIDDLVEGGFIIKLSAPTGYRIIKGDITFEITAKNGVEITREILDEFSDYIFGKEVSKEKAAGASIPVKDWYGNQSTYPGIVRPKEAEIQIPKFEDIEGLSGLYIDTSSSINSTDLGIFGIPENYNVYPTEDLAKAAQVQGKLYQCYFATLEKNCPDWKPDYTVCVPKWGISFVERDLEIHSFNKFRLLFPFPTKELAQAFLYTHKEDLEIYKPLM